MVPKRFIYLILCFIFFAIAISQTRYIDPVFNEVEKQEDVVYGISPDLPFIFWVESNTNDIELDMDIYEPVGDTILNRPAIIFLHSGAFFSGDNNADDMVDLSIESAKRGYVSFNANYRLGLNILSTYSGERAVYRGVQDASAIIRFIREYAEEYRIDPNKIFIWGSSAGAFIGLHLSACDDTERPESSYGGSSDPDLGCIDCEGNDYIHSSKPNALVSCWGAIGDLEWIDPEDSMPMILFHGTLDLIVPFDEGFPFTLNIALPIVSGSNQIHEHLDSHEIYHEFYPAENEPHEYWGTLNGTWIGGPTEHWDSILENSYQFLYNQISDDLIGDLNQDGYVNVLDVIDCVNVVLSSVYEDYADINNDGSNNILDIIILVNIIII